MQVNDANERNRGRNKKNATTPDRYLKKMLGGNKHFLEWSS